MHSETAYVAFGANLGDRRANIRSAVSALDATPGVRVTRVSSLIENPAVGGPEGSPAFLNGVAEVETTLDAHALLARLLEIERGLGRERRTRWAPRAIDLDLILYGQQVIEAADLNVPHPLMHERQFVLEPLAEIAPNAMHPVLKRSVRSLLDDIAH